jgi:hypothetical protein
MLNLLAANWIWILFLGAMLMMHRGHGHVAGGCGGGRSGTAAGHDVRLDQVEDSASTGGGSR